MTADEARRRAAIFASQRVPAEKVPAEYHFEYHAGTVPSVNTRKKADFARAGCGRAEVTAVHATTQHSAHKHAHKHAAPHKRLSRTRVLYLLNVVLYWYMYSCCRYVLVAQGSHDGSLKPRRHPMCRARQQLPVAGWHARPPAPRGGGRHLRHRRPAKALRLPEVLSAVQRVGTLQHARIYLSDYGLCARLATRLRA